MLSIRQVHEKYHHETRSVRKVISENNFTYRILLETLNKQLPVGSERILDIGCGAGTICFYLARKGYFVTGIDIAQKAINECNKSARNLNLKNTEFKRVNFPSDKFSNVKYGLVIFTEVIEHLEQDTLAIEKIHKLLKPHGKLILSTPSINAPLYKLGLANNFDKRVGHIRRYSIKHLEILLKGANFKVIETRKTEGILRNFLFVNPHAGILVRIINHFGSDFITLLDNIALKFFGESNYIIVAEKL